VYLHLYCQQLGTRGAATHNMHTKNHILIVRWQALRMMQSTGHDDIHMAYACIPTPHAPQQHHASQTPKHTSTSKQVWPLRTGQSSNPQKPNLQAAAHSLHASMYKQPP
jgi:outer membrane receptor for monomeric catechols